MKYGIYEKSYVGEFGLDLRLGIFYHGVCYRINGLLSVSG